MEHYQLIVTLIILAIMSISFLIHKIPYGLTAMCCAVALALLGVIEPKAAFAGVSHSTTVLVATMMVVAGSLNKTSVAQKIRNRMSVIQGKAGFLLVFLICAFSAILCQLIDMNTVMAIMLMIIQTLDDESDISHSRMIFLCAAIICAWFGRFPVGMGAALPFVTNGYYEGVVNSDPAHLLGLTDILKVGLLPSIALTIYCILAYRLIPKQPLNIEVAKNTTADLGETKISKKAETIILAVFVLTLGSFFFSTLLGDRIYVIPALGILVLIFTKVISIKEVMAIMTSDIVWMVAGIQVISAALSASGAVEVLGNMVLKLLGGHPSSLFVITVFCVITTLMTNFLSNFGTLGVMAPIAASTALAGGMNVKAVVVVVFCASCLAVGFPTGTSCGTIAYALGNHNPVKLLKFNIPYLIIGMVTLIISASVFFPVYG
ncbi:MAG: SLC13 family permease [Eubacteriales bacterium]|nr:SLC13 family permease [Eubacteriales bacterium]